MKQLGETTVREYMTQQAIVVDDTARLTDAIRMMDDNQLSVIPVVDEQETLVGILSNSDLIGIMHEIQSDLVALNHVRDKTRDFLIRILMEQGDNTQVKDVMTSPVETISADDNLVVAAQKLNAKQYHHLPVICPDCNVIGIISTLDFVRAIAENGALATGSGTDV